MLSLNFYVNTQKIASLRYQHVRICCNELRNWRRKLAGAVRAKKLDLVRFLGTSAKISKYVADFIIRSMGYMHIMPN